MRTTAFVLTATLAVSGLVCVAGAETSGAAVTADRPTASSVPAGATAHPGRPLVPVVAGTVTTGLTSPWGLAFLYDGSALVAERDTAQIRRVRRDGTAVVVGTVPGVQHGGEGGLLGLAVRPSTFWWDHYVYAYFTTATDNRIARMRYVGGSLGAPEVILSGIPAARAHNGGRLAFGPDGFLYVGTGDATVGTNAQDLASLGGKILRIRTDGSPAPGNPFGTAVWSYGHRNVQGLAFDPWGRLWADELGAGTWDELNLIRPGNNYGWPVVEGAAHDPRFVDPLAQWATSQASPSGLAYSRGALWMAGLRGQRLWRIQVRGDQVVGEPEAFFTGVYGRLRTVVRTWRGDLWLVTSNTDGRGTPQPGDDRILRVRLTR